ncbi:sugar phosphate isomerase/epimerase family protein [Streptomyces sp. HYC2]|uniref:sugar phosphate isomerase/epimerase family protein n=1 Tax=Streptomyces sp. HYC2 TaxID=2955207 RepID=UPI0024813213|nr:sugar phosphate isomerase/epimerase family protein [Streptomyces sp. HYC2]
MNRRQALKAAMTAALAAPLALNPLSQAVAATPAAPAAQPSGTSRRYNSSVYPVSMSLYCFNQNINSWIKGRSGKSAPPITTVDAITWAKNAGCDQVDITSYFIPGYDTHTMPTRPADEITAFAADLRTHCDNIGIGVSGTGVFNDFADPDDSRRELDVQRTKFWTDIAAVLGAPGIRVFSGVVPDDLDTAGGWEGVTRSRIVPALREVTAYAAAKGVEVTLQNHGDMTATAEQTLQMLDWVGDANLSIMDDTGYFRPFQAPTGDDYDWYHDIMKVLPRSSSIQVKRKPAGAESDGPMMDYQRLFTGLRLSDYRGYLPCERLWDKDAADNPKNQPTPPFEQIASFLDEVKAGLASSQADPFSALATAITREGQSGGFANGSWRSLANMADQAGQEFARNQPAAMNAHLANLQRGLASEQNITPATAQTLQAQLDALLLPVADVFG